MNDVRMSCHHAAAVLHTIACVGKAVDCVMRHCVLQVGVGLKPAVCKATCEAWHRACAGDFFTFDPRLVADGNIPAMGDQHFAMSCFCKRHALGVLMRDPGAITIMRAW